MLSHLKQCLLTADRMELGFGATGAWAADWFSEKKALSILKTALDGGIRHFDTASFYAGGKADERLARLLDKLEAEGAVYRQSITLSTKIGKRIDESGRIVRDFSEAAIVDTVARHIRLFGGQGPDIVYMHGPDKKERHQSLPVLQQLKADGALKAIGECHDYPHLETAADTDGIDVLMGRYHFLNRTNAHAFRLAKAKGKKIVSIAPLAQGLWSRKLLLPKSLSGAWYLARAVKRDPHTLIAAQRQSWYRNVPDWPVSHLALAYVRANPDIDVVLTTTTQESHLNDSLTAFERDITPDIRELLEANKAVTALMRED